MSMDNGPRPVTKVLPFNSSYGPRERVRLDASAETHGTNVKQSFRDEVDVNNVVARFQATGVLPEGSPGREPLYLDVAEFPSYQEAMVRVREVESFFAGLPAEQREAFDNDPQAFADWATDPANYEAARSLGVEPVRGPGVEDGSVSGVVEPSPSSEGSES